VAATILENLAEFVHQRSHSYFNVEARDDTCNGGSPT